MKRFGELSIFRYCSGRCKPSNANGRWRVYSARRGWTIFTPASKKKSGEISVSSTGLFCFTYTEGLFSFTVLYSICLSPAFAPQSTYSRPRLALLTRSPVTWSFSLGRNQRSWKQRPLQSNTICSGRVESERTIHKERGIRANA